MELWRHQWSDVNCDSAFMLYKLYGSLCAEQAPSCPCLLETAWASNRPRSSCMEETNLEGDKTPTKVRSGHVKVTWPDRTWRFRQHSPPSYYQKSTEIIGRHHDNHPLKFWWDNQAWSNLTLFDLVWQLCDLDLSLTEAWLAITHLTWTKNETDLLQTILT